MSVRLRVLATATLVFPLLHATGAAAAPATPAAPAQPACTPYRELSRTVDSDGATIHRYRTPLGGIATQVVPPRGFRPLTAPDAQLEKYGIGARPKDPALLAEWKDRWRDAKVYVDAPTCVPADKRVRSTSGSLNWSGIYQFPYGTDTSYYRKVTADLVQPSWRFSCPHQSSESSWVALFGILSHRLMQIGTYADVNDGALYRAFYEYVKPNPSGSGNIDSGMLPIPITVRPGDVIAPQVAYRSAGYGEWTMLNRTTGEYWTWNEADGTFYDGDNAAYIDERPSYVTGGQPLLRDFGSVFWNHAYAWNKFGTQLAPGNTYHDSFYSYDRATGVTTAKLVNGMTTSISWTDFWQSCGT